MKRGGGGVGGRKRAILRATNCDEEAGVTHSLGSTSSADDDIYYYYMALYLAPTDGSLYNFPPPFSFSDFHFLSSFGTGQTVLIFPVGSSTQKSSSFIISRCCPFFFLNVIV